MKPFFIPFLLFLASLFISCGEHKTNRQLFEENFDYQVAASIHVLIERGIDTASARNICSCLLEKLYIIDSTFFLEDKVRSEDFFQKYAPDAIKDCVVPYAGQHLPQEVD